MTTTHVLLTVLAAVLASQGLWTLVTKIFFDRPNNQTKLLLGLAHNEIVRTSVKYIRRGYVTVDEYEDYMKYLYTPYETFGGNGLAEKLKNEVIKLEIKDHHIRVEKEKQHEQF